MTQDELKAAVGAAAVAEVPEGAWIGVGTGSTVNCFIDALARSGRRIAGAVSSSNASTARMQGHGLPVVAADAVQRLAVYIDGADEIDPRGFMIKGGGAALTREKIVADLADRFVCIADASKRVAVLGAFPLPVEVIEMAAPQLIRRFSALGGTATLRPGVRTDNGNPVLDVRGLRIEAPLAMEAELSQWPGVVTVGIFARHGAQRCLLGTPDGVETIDYPRAG